VTPDLITRCLEKAAEAGSAAAALPVTDTLHQSDPEGCAARTVERAGLWAMQTPQVFPAVLIRDLLVARSDGTPPDEVSVALSAGWRVPFVSSLQANPKITWPGDLAVAEALLLAREEIISAS
jgi:2-C-methyl-D-erythritol 4-phosphate cytidylyltransferase